MLKIGTWKSGRRKGKYYAVNDEGLYLHKDLTFRTSVCEDGVFDTEEELIKLMAPLAGALDEVNAAIYTLHRYFSQPLVCIDPEASSLLNKSFYDVIKENPYK